MDRLKAQRGMTLAEVMIGIMIFSIGASGSMAAFVAATKQVGGSRYYGVATAALRSEGETVLLTPYPNLASLALTTFTPGGTFTGDPVVFKKQWTVTPNLSTGASTVLVTISWTTNSGSSSVSDTFTVVE